ncbi:MAG: DUF4384 domain-containing protein [Nitrospirae bacterium]|nr:DUF4384 domain-containing protein [Nitrospirota bacterium]
MYFLNTNKNAVSRNHTMRALLLKVLFLATVFAFSASSVYAGQSVIVESEGSACVERGRGYKEAEKQALENAKTKAKEIAVNHTDNQALKDSYKNAEVTIIKAEPLKWANKGKTKCAVAGIEAELSPRMRTIFKNKDADYNVNEPQKTEVNTAADAPLVVSITTDKRVYGGAEQIKVYLKGNKAFYAKVIYEDSKGGSLQLLPNPYRTDILFEAGKQYEIPSSQDAFVFEVSPPFGKEKITVYAATHPLGDIMLNPLGGVYEVKTASSEIPRKLRGVKIKKINSAAASETQGTSGISEMYEDTVHITTQQR